MEMNDRVRLAHLIKSTNQRTVIIDLVRRHGWRVGAEIGVLKGKTLFSVLDACPRLKMYGVDQWRVLPLRPDENAETYSVFDMGKIEREVFAKASNYPDRCVLLKGDSVSMSEKVADGTLDFIFIDGDHTEAGVRRDIDAWERKVRSGGMILGHDISWNSVSRVVSEKFPQFSNFGEEVWGTVRP